MEKQESLSSFLETKKGETAISLVQLGEVISKQARGGVETSISALPEKKGTCTGQHDSKNICSRKKAIKA